LIMLVLKSWDLYWVNKYSPTRAIDTRISKTKPTVQVANVARVIFSFLPEKPLAHHGRHQQALNIPDRALSIQDLLEPLPDFQEVTEQEKQNLFLKKLRLCCVLIETESSEKLTPRHNVAKKRKREILVELVGYMTSQNNWFTEPIVQEVLHMVEANCFRELPDVQLNINNNDQEEPYSDPNWPLLQLVYELFHRFVLCFSDSDSKVLKKYLTEEFLYSMILAFNSEDARERDYLKTILHRIYGKIMTLRAYIKRAIGGVLSEIIYETHSFAGVAELLEILGSIINGFAIPLKAEHKKFLKEVLVPLHKYDKLHEFHQHLTYCITQFLEKDPTLCGFVLRGLIRYWPVISSHKEVLFLSEVEEILALTPPEEFELVMLDLFRCLTKAMTSTQFQVAERALFLWNNDVIVIYLCDFRTKVLPIVYPALQRNCSEHWNTTVQSLTFNVIKMFMEMDPELFEKIQKEHALDKKRNPALALQSER